jgi:fumarate reductase flavoprotein subunit
MNRETHDLLVVGGGLAGLAAATRAAFAGFRVCILEQSSDQAYLCNSRYVSGLFHIAGDDMLAPAARAKANVMRITQGETREELVDALVANVPRAIQWLKYLGVRFIVAGPDGLRRNSLAPPGARQTGLNWRGRSGDVMLRTLERALVGLGGVIERGVTAQSLIMQDGRCVGVTARKAGVEVQYAANNVLLADGGFQADLELLRLYISPRPEALLQRNAESGRGSGIRMAQAVGAKLIGMDRFYGHLQYRAALTDKRFWPYPVLDPIASAGIVVNHAAKRFCDESGGGVYIANAIARQPFPDQTYIIFDQAIWAGPGRDWLLPANPYLMQAGGEVTRADTIEALAAKLNLDPQTLRETVEGYNAILQSGQSVAGQPARGNEPYKPWPLERGPFYGVPICAGITYTMGGILTDGQARVLDAHETPIAGLYAAGSTTGGLEGGGRMGYCGGLAKSATFGFLAAESLIRSRPSPGASN